MLEIEATPDEAPVPVANGAVLRGILTVDEVALIERTPEEVELTTTIVEDEIPVLRGTEYETPVPVGPTTTIDEVPLPYGELSVLVEET